MKLLGTLIAAAAVGTGVYLLRGGGGGSFSGARGRRRIRLGGEAEADELKLFIDNDGDLYRGQTTSILKNLITKIARGDFDSVKAEKLWMHLVESGAKKYAREFGSEFISDRPGVPWNKMFSMDDRRAVAKAMNTAFMRDARDGQYDHLLPKKYQKHT